MIRNDVLIYTAVFWFFVVFAIALAAPEINHGCVASAYQAEMRGFDLQENLAACL
jgi:hypothetical protein